MLLPIVVLNDTRVDRHHGCSRVLDVIHMLSRREGMDVCATAPAHQDWRCNAAFMRHFEQARLVIVNGEGSIHHNSAEAAWLLEAGAAARQRGIPAAIINMSWEANNLSFVQRLHDFALVATRETRSAGELADYGLVCRTVPDLSIFTEHPGRGTRAQVGFTDSVLRDTTVKLERMRKAVRGQTIPIQYSERGLGGTSQFFLSYMARSELSRPRRLRQVLEIRLRQFAAQSGSTADLVERIARLKLLVTGRYHAVNFALVAKTPVVAVETNSHKIAALLDDVGIDRSRLTTADVLSIEHVKAAAGWYPEEERRIDDYVAAGRRDITALFADIRKLA